MSNTVVILSGASKGIGAATAAEFLRAGATVVNISRTKNTDLVKLAEQQQAKLINIQSDLSKLDEIGLKAEFEKLPRDATRYVLINNAGAVHPIANTATIPTNAAQQAFMLNCVAPMLLTKLFINTFADIVTDKRIVNISSGAGRHAIPGWGVYCATKSALDMYSQVLAAEHPTIKVVSLAPGIVDTDMQQNIRSASPNEFPDLEKFKAYKASGQLNSPELVGKKIYQFIEHPSFGSETLMDIRNFNAE